MARFDEHMLLNSPLMPELTGRVTENERRKRGRISNPGIHSHSVSCSYTHFHSVHLHILTLTPPHLHIPTLGLFTCTCPLSVSLTFRRCHRADREKKTDRRKRHLKQPAQQLSIDELRKRFKALGVDVKGKKKKEMAKAWEKLGSITMLYGMGTNESPEFIKKKAKAVFGEDSDSDEPADATDDEAGANPIIAAEQVVGGGVGYKVRWPGYSIQDCLQDECEVSNPQMGAEYLGARIQCAWRLNSKGGCRHLWWDNVMSAHFCR